MILFFEDVDNLLRTVYAGVRVEQCRVIGRIEHHVGTYLLGIGFDRGEYLFLDRLDHFDTLFHQGAVIAEECFLILLCRFFFGQDVVFPSLARRGRERGFLVHVIVVERLHLGELRVYHILILFGQFVQRGKRSVVGVDGLEDDTHSPET